MQALYDDTTFETGKTSGQRSLEIAAKRQKLSKFVNEREPADEEESEAEDELNEEERRIANQIKASLAARGEA